MDPASKAAVIVLIHAEDAPLSKFTRGVMKIVGAPLAKATARVEPAVGPEADLARFEGSYRSPTGKPFLTQESGAYRLRRVE